MAYLGDLVCSTRRYSAHKGRCPEVLEKACKELDRFILPKKLVMTVEGRDRHVVDFSNKTLSTLEVVERWKMSSGE
jgi:hypothetical protein